MTAHPNPSRRATILASVVLALGLVAAGCGSSAEALPKPEFIQQANAICTEGNAELEQIFDAFFASFTEEDFAAMETDPAAQDPFWVRMDEVMDDARPVMETMLSDLRDLPPPEGDGGLVTDLLEDFERTLDDLDAEIDAAAAGDAQVRQRISDSEDDPFADVNERAREYGLTVCGEPG